MEMLSAMQPIGLQPIGIAVRPYWQALSLGNLGLQSVDFLLPCSF